VQIDSIPLGFGTCYLLRDRGTVMIDAGGSDMGGAFAKRLVRLGVAPHDITLVVITHGHFDHAGSANEIRAATGARIAIHGADAALVEEGRLTVPPGTTRWGRWSLRMLGPLFARFVKLPPFHPDVLLDDDGMDLSGHGIAGRVVFTPGHTMGSVSVVLDSGEAFVGDLAMNKLPLTARPSLPIYADDIDAVKRSWEKLRGLGARTIYPAHGKSFPIAALDRQLG
jgi:glyoxylase-like metal-dependent hydrolase (beta-lactamase superfamily II)